MIRRASKIALEIAGFAVAATALLFLLLGWRLSSGPLSLPILSQILEDTVNRQLPGGKLVIGDTILRWSQTDRHLGLRLVDVTLTGADGNKAAAIPEMSFSLNVPALLLGQLAPKQIDFYGVSATLLRRPNGGISLGLASAKDEVVDNNSGILDAMLETLRTGSSDSTIFSRLSHIGIHDASLRFIDEMNHYSVEAPNANFAVFKSPDGLAGTLSADLTLGDTKGRLELSGELPVDGKVAHIHMVAANIVPAALARMSPEAMANYALFDAPINAEGELVVRETGTLKSAQLKLTAGKGKFILPGLDEVPVPLQQAQADLFLDAEANRLTLKTLVFKAGPHNVAMKGSAQYSFGSGVNISSAHIVLDAGKTTTEVPGFFEGALQISRAHFDGTLDFDKRAIAVETLSLGLKEGVLSISGTVKDGDRSPAVDMKGKIGALSMETLKTIWPLPLAKGARKWLVENVKQGRIENADFFLNVPAGMLADADNHKAMPNDLLRLTFDIKDGVMTYIDDMPLMTNVIGRGVLQGNRFDAFVDRAQVEAAPGKIVALSKGRFTDETLAKEGTIGEIEFTASGMTADILGLLDHEPLKLISDFGLDPATVGGHGSVTTLLHLPLVKDIRMDDIDFSGKAHAEEISIPDIEESISITSGTLDVDVARSGLTGKGPVSINGGNPLMLEWTESFVPTKGPGTIYHLTGQMDDASREAMGLDFKDYITGPVGIDARLTGNGAEVNDALMHVDLGPSESRFNMLGWTKPVGKSVTLDFNIAIGKDEYRFSDFKASGENVNVSGSFVMDKAWRFMAIDLPVLKLGPDNDLVAKARRDEAGQLLLDVRGPKANASGILHSLLSGSGDKEDAEKAAQRVLTPEMEADQTLRTRITVKAENVAGQNETGFSRVTGDVTLIEDWAYLMDVRGVDQNEAAFEVMITPAENRTRKFSMKSDDAGFIFRTLDLFTGVEGGTLEAEGLYDDKVTGLPMKGEVKVRQFRVVKAPVLAKILTLGSLTGIGDTLQGEGIYFEKLKLPFKITGYQIYIDDAYMTGPALGLTMNGEIDRVSNVNALEGTIVPAYTINSVLGKIPFLGPLIVGREGEGVFGFTYGVKGTTGSPNVYVNPLAAIAPGFLRRLFEFSDTVPKSERSGPEQDESKGAETTSPAAGSSGKETQSDKSANGKSEPRAPATDTNADPEPQPMQ